MPDRERNDACAWGLISWLGCLAAVFIVLGQALEFWPFQGPHEGVRLALDLACVPVFLCLLVSAVWLAAAAAWALFKRRARRALSLIAALAAMPLLIGPISHLNMFDPYYWYVIANKAVFEAQARSASEAGAAAFAIIERRDVSIGFVTTPPRYTSIIYDESDEIGLDSARRSEDWKSRHLEQLDLAAGGYVESWYWVKHLTGHFFLLRAGG